MHDRLLASKLSALTVHLGDEAEARTFPNSASTAAALLTLLHRGRCAVSELASILRVAQPTATRLINKLEKAGLVRRLPAAGRSVPLALTGAGEAAARTLQDRRLAAFAEACAVLEENERAALDELLTKMLGARVRSRRHARQICRLCDHGVCDGPNCPVGCAASEIETGGSTPC